MRFYTFSPAEGHLIKCKAHSVLVCICCISPYTYIICVASRQFYYFSFIVFIVYTILYYTMCIIVQYVCVCVYYSHSRCVIHWYSATKLYRKTLAKNNFRIGVENNTYFILHMRDNTIICCSSHTYTPNKIYCCLLVPSRTRRNADVLDCAPKRQYRTIDCLQLSGLVFG